jgi:hypothetical protein
VQLNDLRNAGQLQASDNPAERALEVSRASPVHVDSIIDPNIVQMSRFMKKRNLFEPQVSEVSALLGARNAHLHSAKTSEDEV